MTTLAGLAVIFLAKVLSMSVIYIDLSIRCAWIGLFVTRGCLFV
jgi:hypothetical protein